jgi:hypothetical protein
MSVTHLEVLVAGAWGVCGKPKETSDRKTGSLAKIGTKYPKN